MNQITSYLIQTNKVGHPWNWEVKLAKGADGNYLGSATSNAYSQDWIEIKADNLEEAFEFMKNFCERKTK